MSRLIIACVAVAVAAAFAIVPTHTPSALAQTKKKSAPDTSAEESLAQVKLADPNLKATVWAAEPLFANPVAFAFDEKGRVFVAETTRFRNGVPDTRSHMYWLDEDLANRTLDDLVAMYKKHNYKGFEGFSDQLRMVWDSTGSGKADKSTIFSGGYNRPQDGLAAGVFARNGSVYFACIPDLYLLKDTKGDNLADQKKSLFTGFGPTAQFLGHDLHGLRMGPDGKLYFSIGDRGFNVTTKEGKKLEYPNTGAVLRCELDGSNLEVVHHGLRNPQELAFDDFGNLFTFDNNSDSGDRARWVNIVEGGDSGWRGGFQYGTLYHTPEVPQGNRGPWNVEKLWLPHWDGQAAYIVPALANLGNGPAGLTHYPGVGLNDKYRDNFFACDFTSNSNSSKIWAVAFKPKGASFEMAKSETFISGLVPTDCDFGPDGAFYWSDWVGGWDPPGKGRIVRVTDSEAMKNPAVAEAQKLLAAGMEKLPVDELEKLLEHPHQQVRLEAQYELVRMKADGRLSKVARLSKNQLARLHAIWGLGVLARTERDSAEVLIKLMDDADHEVRRCVVQQIGTAIQPARGKPQFGPDVEQAVLRAQLLKLLRDPDARVRAATAVTYGKVGQLIPVRVRPTQEQEFYGPLFEMLKTNDDKDPYLRHAAVMGLYHGTRNPIDLWNAWTLAKSKYDLASVRMGVLLALRKHGSDKVAEFLNDSEPRIVAEAARAIYDTRLTNSFPALAKLAEKSGQPDAVAYRALAACLWESTPDALARFAARASEPDHTRVAALKLLADWPNPPRRDPITGLTLDLPKRDAATAANALKVAGVAVFTGSDVVRREAAQIAAKLGVKEFGPLMAGIVKDSTQPVSLRVEALFAVHALKDSSTKQLAGLALESPEPLLRAAGRSVKARLEPATVLAELPQVLGDAQTSLAEKQGAFSILAAASSSQAADKLLDEWLDAAIAGKVREELILDVLDAAETRANTPKLETFAPLKKKVQQYRAAKAKEKDALASHLESLAGGDAERGRSIFLNNSAVYCQRCHQLDGQGGEVGPQLNGIAADKEKDRRYLLESIVLPNAKIAKGFETVILVLTDERTVSGVVKAETPTEIRLITPENKELVIPTKDVDSRRTGQSAMPADLHTKISRRELRDVVEFLANLKTPPKK